MHPLSKIHLIGPPSCQNQPSCRTCKDVVKYHHTTCIHDRDRCKQRKEACESKYSYKSCTKACEDAIGQAGMADENIRANQYDNCVLFECPDKLAKRRGDCIQKAQVAPECQRARKAQDESCEQKYRREIDDCVKRGALHSEQKWCVLL